MKTRNSLIFSVVAAAVVTTLAGTASAEVGKKVSVATGGASPIAEFPLMSDAATVAVPSSYKSKANFLKVTASYSAGCSGGDYMGPRFLSMASTCSTQGFLMRRSTRTPSARS
jgi:hypothetical protein